ncbi:Nucleoporin p58/p45, partial [Haplosporangium sp. Z 27]
FGATPSTPTAAAPPPATKPFAGPGLTISTPANSFAPPASSQATLTTSTAAAPTTSTSLFPTLSLPSNSAATSATSAPSLFASAPATLNTGSLFASSNSTAASNALTSAAGKNLLSSSSTAAASGVALTPDTIAGSTKYTELPADAKTTLDQFHSFLQGQIHLSATLTARPSESLDKIAKDTEELSKRLTTLNDALERDTKVIQALQDKVGQELKQADSAGRIIEAYANTSHANFLYAGNNSAGTLPEVLRNQHEGFLAVAVRVAALHDEVKDREKAYLMFRRKFFDDDSDPFQANIKHRKTETTQLGQSLRNSTRSIEGQKSFREIAKETLRPGNIKGSSTAPTAPAATATGSSLFGAPSTSGTSLFGASAPAPASGTSLFGASAAPASGTSLFGAAAPASSTSLFGAAAPASGTSLFGVAGPASTSAAPTFSLTAPTTSTPGSSLFGNSTNTTGFGAFKK